MKRLILNAIFFFPAILFAQNSVKLHGKVATTSKISPLYIFKKQEQKSIVIDSIKINKDRSFSKGLKVGKPGIYYIGFTTDSRDAVWVDNEDIEINFNVDGSSVIKGGKLNTFMNTVNQVSSAFFSKMYGPAPSGGNIDRRKVMTDYNQELIALAKSNSSLPSVIYVLSFFDFDRDAAFIKEISEVLLKSNPQNSVVHDYVKESKRLSIGAVATDFDFLTIDGEQTSLKKVIYNSRYLLVDFWGTYCAPCRKGIPGIKKLYAEYHSKGLDVLTISIDAKAEMWKNSVKEEDMPWPQGLAVEAGQKVMEAYRFNGIPYLALFDQVGNIVALHITHEELEDKFRELMGEPEPTPKLATDDMNGEETAEMSALIEKIISKDLLARYTPVFANETEEQFISKTIKTLSEQVALKEFQRAKIGEQSLPGIYRQGKMVYEMTTDDRSLKQAGYQDFEKKFIGFLRYVLLKPQYEKYLRLRSNEL